MFYFKTNSITGYTKEKMMHLWIDIETTGLNPKNDLMLEIAWFLTDENLNHLTIPQASLVKHNRDHALDLLRQDDLVYNMHINNGLAVNYIQVSNGYFKEDSPYAGRLLDYETIEDLILADIYQHRKNDEPIVLSGASVHFDRSFLSEVMPRLENILSHRHMDTSVIRMMMRHCGVEHLSAQPSHRAYDDIIETYSQLTEYYQFIKDAVTITHCHKHGEYMEGLK